MTPSFFGRSDRQLLGIHHPPRGRQAWDFAALLLYPAPQEYTRAHWAFRRLAAQLAREGVACLRFDYSGTGDSAGEVRDATFERWLEDVATASEELADLAGVSRVSLVGFRLGAALAVEAARRGRGPRVKELVLWEPVARGKRHLEELRALDALQAGASRTPPRRTPGMEELLGLELSPGLRASLEAVDLLASPPPAVERAVLAVSEVDDEVRALERHLASGGGAVELREVREESGTGAAQVESAMLSGRILQEIVTSLTRRAA
ncbi:alpha/beta fold hydrolase [Aggregicoccus sp. 17bor-14]|uniref:alpha/beta fold hydrolase n=1 Tax=Myxococcaceae TaxID=31 RepID=UPI00129C19DD|nr:MULTISPECIES: alpha/beta fold hydrolase [Myxococcaceae]MBF5042077.1 alpha/beta fold hydrolase [Simulacricoccus sp. 17bor-14]MRI87855.1 alpha/beta fold hydrolase [Aggregicoccus sp. 17bor-14]